MVGADPPAASTEPERFDPGAFAGLPPEPALVRLPPGRHGLPRAFVADQQRLRLIAAMLRVLPRHGYPATTIGHIAAEASVSRSALYKHFADKEECFLATYDLAAEWFCERVERAAGPASDRAGRVRAGVGEARELLVANPAVAHLFAVEALQAGAAARARQQACRARLVTALRDEGDPPVPPEIEELLLGGSISLIAAYVDSGRAAELERVMTTLVESLLVPYLDPRNLGATLASSERRRSRWQPRP